MRRWIPYPQDKLCHNNFDKFKQPTLGSISIENKSLTAVDVIKCLQGVLYSNIK